MTDTTNYWSAKFTIRRTTDNSLVTVADVVIASEHIPDLTHTAHRLGILEDPRTAAVQEGPVPIDIIEETLFAEEPTLAYDKMKVWRISITDK